MHLPQWLFFETESKQQNRKEDAQFLPSLKTWVSLGNYYDIFPALYVWEHGEQSKEYHAQFEMPYNPWVLPCDLKTHEGDCQRFFKCKEFEKQKKIVHNWLREVKVKLNWNLFSTSIALIVPKAENDFVNVDIEKFEKHIPAGISVWKAFPERSYIFVNFNLAEKLSQWRCRIILFHELGHLWSKENGLNQEKMKDFIGEEICNRFDVFWEKEREEYYIKHGYGKQQMEEEKYAEMFRGMLMSPNWQKYISKIKEQTKGV